MRTLLNNNNYNKQLVWDNSIINYNELNTKLEKLPKKFEFKDYNYTPFTKRRNLSNAKLLSRGQETLSQPFVQPLCSKVMSCFIA